MSIDVRVLRNFLSVVSHRSIGRAAAMVKAAGIVAE